MRPVRRAIPWALLPAVAVAAVLAVASATAPAQDAPGGETSAPAGGPTDGRAAPIRVERLGGDSVGGTRLAALADGKLVLEAGPVRHEVALDDVTEISFPTAPDPARAAGPLEVAADLWTGESVFGELRGGDEEHVDVDAPLLGRLRIAIENVRAVRFLQRLSLAAEPPDLTPRADSDVVHLAGGDRFTGTVEGFGPSALRSRTAQKETVDVPYERLVAVTLLADEARRPATPDGALRVALRDGTRVLGADARLEANRLRFRSPSGFSCECAIADVVALQVVSRRFDFLSSLAPAKTEVKPVWEVAAGDPAVLFAPRTDLSFSGRPLRCGGRSWLDGIGVFSGTTLTWDLGGRYREFRTSAGLDDGAGPLGGVVFRVLVDGKQVWDSGFVRPAAAAGRGAASPVATPRIPLEGAKTLTLVVLPGDAEDPYPVQDEADWLGPILVCAGT